MADSQSDPPTAADRLKHALVAMFGRGQPQDAEADAASSDGPGERTAERGASDEDPCPISPRTIFEALLFVGQPDNRPLSSEEAAAMMRGVDASEVERLVEELQALYEADTAAYEIHRSAEGFRLQLQENLVRTRDKFYGRLRQARLSRSAIEVLSIVAYHQPTTHETIDQLRGTPSGAILSQLVRRQLLRLERPEQHPRRPFYFTTDRFLRLFGLSSLEDLPECDELQQGRPEV